MSIVPRRVPACAQQALEVAHMTHRQKPTEAERELKAYGYEQGILHHAQQLADIAGCARAIKALQSALLDIERKAADGSVKPATAQAVARSDDSH